MKFFDYFFRMKPDNFRFKSYGDVHISMMAIWLFICLAIYLFREDIKKSKILSRGIRASLSLLIVVQQIGFYYFYSQAASGFDLVNGLPLHNCRLALITALIALVFDLKFFRAITLYIGIIGGILPMLIPDLEPYAFPHMMYITFFITHFAIFWSSAFFLFVDEYKFNLIEYKKIALVLNVYLLLSLLVNLNVSGANYGYLIDPPILKAVKDFIPQFIYTSLAFITHNILVYLVYRIGYSLQNKKSPVKTRLLNKIPLTQK